MKIFKTILTLFAFQISLFANAQMYERGKKNFFIEPEGEINFSNHKSNAFTGSKFGTSYGLSAGKVFLGFLKTGIVFRYNQNLISNFDSTIEIHSPVQTNTIAIKSDLMIPFLNFSLGKSKHYECTSLTNYLFLGPEFGYNFGPNNSNYSINAFNVLLNAGYGMIFKKSGSNKKQAANDIYIVINMKKGLSAFVSQSSDSQKFYSTYWGLSLTWIHYKTGNWLR